MAGFLINLVRTQSQAAALSNTTTYTEGIAGRAQFANPLLRETTAEQDLVSLVFSGLTRTDEHGQIVADLAEGWTIMDDGLTYVFTLREHARWHDGAPVTADDVIFTIALLQDETSDLLPSQAPLWRTITVDKLDQRTVRFSLSEPLAPFLDYTTLPLLPAHALEHITAQSLDQVPFNQAPIGSGPFRLVDMAQDHIKLKAFEAYYGVKPYLDAVEFRLYPDMQSLLTAYQAGEVQAISQLSTRDLDVAGQLSDLAIYSAQQARCVALFLNLDRPPLEDHRVRRALLAAIDRQGLIDEHLGGQAIVANSPIFPGSWAYTSDLPTVEFDIEAARALLEEAGWHDTDDGGVRRNREEEPLELEILTNNDPLRRALAEAIARQWTEVGVRTSVRTADIVTLRTRHLQPREFDVLLYGWVQMTADPDPYPLWHSSQIEGGQNYAGLQDRAIDDLLESGRRTNDIEERRRLYRDFQERFAKALPALPLYHPVYHYGVDKRVQNVHLPQIIFHPSDRFQTLYRWYVSADQESTRAESPLFLRLWNRDS